MSLTIGKVLASLSATLLVLLGVLATYNVHVAVNPVEPTFGAVSTLDGVDSPYKNIAGLKGWEGTRSMVATSSNFCVLKNPLGVAAVIEAVSFNATTNRIGAVSYDVSTSTDGFATSTIIIGRGTLAAAGTADRYSWAGKQATSTVSFIPLATSGSLLLEGSPFDQGTTRFVLGASEFINIRLSTSTGTVFASGYNVGTCGFKLRAF